MADDAKDDDATGSVCPDCGEHHNDSDNPAVKHRDAARRLNLGIQALFTKVVADLPEDAGAEAQAFLLHEAIRSTVFFASANAWYIGSRNMGFARQLTGRAISRASHEFDMFVENDGKSPGDLGSVKIDRGGDIESTSADELTEKLIAQAESMQSGKTKH